MKTIEEFDKDMSVYAERITDDCKETPILPYSEYPADWWGENHENANKIKEGLDKDLYK